MINLFIDTSSKHILLALIEDNEILSFIDELNDEKLSDRIFPLLECLFEEAKVDQKHIAKIYVVNGPGSFTGVRVGVTIAKTMAWALNIPVVPVSSLEVIASTYYDGDYLIPYIDARRGFVYAGIYDTNLKKIESDKHIMLSDIISKAPKDTKYSLVGYDDIQSSVDVIKPKINIIKIISKHKRSKGVNPHKLVPNYLKLTEAEEKLKK